MIASELKRIKASEFKILAPVAIYNYICYNM